MAQVALGRADIPHVDLGLSDRVYVVTGAHAGLGRACAEQLAAEGARLVLGGQDERALASVATTMGGPDHAIAVSGDLTEPGLETCLVAAAIARYGRLDGALLNQPPAAPSSFSSADDGSWRVSFEELLLAPMRLARAVARHASHEGGSILFLAPSMASQHGDHTMSNTFTQAMSGSVRSMAVELGLRNVRVNAVIPGRVETERRSVDPGVEDLTAYGGVDDVALGRLAEPYELARPAVFLLSPAASYMTGALVRVDGGIITV